MVPGVPSRENCTQMGGTFLRYESPRASSSPGLDLLSFKRQQTVFILLNLLLLLVLVLMHGALAAFWNEPSLGVFSVAAAFF